MPSKKDVERAVKQGGTVHPIAKTEQTSDGPRMSLVIGGTDQWAKNVADKRAALYHELIARGVEPNQASFMASWEPLPKHAPKE